MCLMYVLAASICDDVHFMLKTQFTLPADGIFRVPAKAWDEVRVNQSMLPCKAGSLLV